MNAAAKRLVGDVTGRQLTAPLAPEEHRQAVRFSPEISSDRLRARTTMASFWTPRANVSQPS